MQNTFIIVSGGPASGKSTFTEMLLKTFKDGEAQLINAWMMAELEVDTLEIDFSTKLVIIEEAPNICFIRKQIDAVKKLSIKSPARHVLHVFTTQSEVPNSPGDYAVVRLHYDCNYKY